MAGLFHAATTRKTGDHGLADNDEELFDIVDNANEVVGRERRSLVHARGLCHRAAYCFVFNAEGALLLQQRSPMCVFRRAHQENSRSESVLCPSAGAGH